MGRTLRKLAKTPVGQRVKKDSTPHYSATTTVLPQSESEFWESPLWSFPASATQAVHQRSPWRVAQQGPRLHRLARRRPAVQGAARLMLGGCGVLRAKD